MSNPKTPALPEDPRDHGGRNESGENPDTRIELGRRLQTEKPADLKRQFKEKSGDATQKAPD
jgi:hypothetical protein